MNEVAIEALNSERPDPLWHNDGSAPFAWAEVFARCDGSSSEPGSDATEVSAEALIRTLTWLAEGPNGEADKELRWVGARAVAAATALKIYERGHGMTQRSVARRLGVPNSTLNDLVHQFHAQFPGFGRRTKTARKPQQIRPELN